MEPTRRGILAGALAAAAAAPALAASDDDLTIERFPIWPGPPPGPATAPVKDVFVKRSPDGPPDDIAWTHVATPMLTVLKPKNPSGAAMLVVPGGGYVRVAVGRTGSGIARSFAARGITTFELLYRLPHDHWAAGPDVSLQDAQRAMRIIRAGAGSRWDVDPKRVAISGYSAGGHLAARTASRSALQTYQPIDTIDRQSDRPDVAGLFFPVITMMDQGVHKQSREELLGNRLHDAQAQHRWSAQLDLPGYMPPTFVACNADDPVVPPENSILMFQALNAAKIPTELMIFEKGGHGPPAPHKDGRPVPWQELFIAFTRDHGWPS
ncbi:MAG: alpha/beta hydrolase [Sphingomonas sp.]